MDFKDISDEMYREYTFPGGDRVRISYPASLNVSASGGHRVLDSAGVSHYLPGTFIHIEWVVKEGKPPFAF